MKTGKKINRKLIISIVLLVITAVFAVTQMNIPDAGRVLIFSIVYIILGVVVMPLTVRMFADFYDGGWLAAKALGLYICGWIMWLFSSIHIMRFSNMSSWIILIIFTLAVYIIRFRSNEFKTEFWQLIKTKINNIVLIESLFLATFVFFSWYLGHKIPSSETERVMDYAIMAALDKSDYMPPMDMWAAGSYLNYYYFGQYIITYLGKLSFLNPEYSYTLGFNLIIPVLFWGIFVLVKTILARLVQKNASVWSTIGGAISSIAVTFSSNMHYFVFYLLNKRFGNVFNLPVNMPEYWFANSSRYIGYYPENTLDRTIIEFPIYSFMIGDLHAHVINMILVITMLMTGYGYMISARKHMEGNNNFSPMLRSILNPYVAAIGFMLGISSMSNSWDFMIYFVVLGSLILFTNIKISGKTGIVYTILQGVWVLLIALSVALPFNMKFAAMVHGLGIVTVRSMPHQLVIVWGYPTAIVIAFVAACIARKKINTQEMFVFLAGLCAIGLAFMPEFVYAKDIYETGFPRANTMFKLSYEAFILFGICSGIILIQFLTDSKRVLKAVAIPGLVCFVACSGYFVTASRQWMGNAFAKGNDYVGIDAMYSFKNENAVEAQAIMFLEDYITKKGEKRPVVLEADGDSYTNSCRVSTLTGFPTIMGWNTHEWLWMDGYDKMNLRKMDASAVYTGTDATITRSILNNYNVEYVFIGLEEYERYGTVQNGIIESMGNVIYSQVIPSGTYIEIVEIDR